jgi:DHA1 family bicyclomycin/chloramphenicol resistance-like MFS transporter
MTNQSHLTRTLSGVEFIGLMAALMALNSLAIDVMLPALPAMGDALGVASDNERQLVISAYMVGFGIAQLFFGPITDRFGRRSPLFVGMVIYIICAFAATFAPTFGLLLAVRFAQGVGAAATRVIAMSVIRDRYSGREMASIMSLTFMVFMALPILAPGIGQVILFVGTWHYIFLFMTGLAIVIMVWAFFRMPETLHPEYRRELKLSVITDGFRLVFGNRLAIFYGIAGMFFFGSNMGFIISSQQIFVDIYKFGDWFPVAFAAVASLMAVANFVNSRIVKQYGQRRVSHSATLVYIACGARSISGRSFRSWRSCSSPLPAPRPTSTRWRWSRSARSPAPRRRCSAFCRRWAARSSARSSASSSTARSRPIPRVSWSWACWSSPASSSPRAASSSASARSTSRAPRRSRNSRRQFLMPAKIVQPSIGRVTLR